MPEMESRQSTCGACDRPYSRGGLQPVRQGLGLGSMCGFRNRGNRVGDVAHGFLAGRMAFSVGGEQLLHDAVAFAQTRRHEDLAA